MTTSSTNNSVFRGFFEKQKLTGPNFIDWYRQLRIVLSIKDKLNYLEQPIPPAPIAPAGQQVAPEILTAHTAWQAEQELFQTTRDFHSCRQEEGQDGIFEIDLSNYLTNESSVYTVSNKRAKLDFDSALLWHCRLGHISKKHIEKLQHDGLLNSSDLRAFEKYVSCMFGNMARKPYTHQVERAKELLGLIHTDKLENQLRKTIKSLRSDRGGEYMSQEFLDHLKDHGIIAHHTPPYTPQHNGVS
nr:hypothetical protein [Tanacetum cinerariifolium]